MSAKPFKDLTARSMALVVHDLKAEADRRQARLVTAEANLETANALYDHRVRLLEAERNADPKVVAARAEKEASQKVVWECVVPDPEHPEVEQRKTTFSAAAEIAERMLVARRAEGTVPTNAKEFETFLKARAAPFERFFPHAWCVEVKEPKAFGPFLPFNPFLLLSATVGYDKPETRIYLAVSGDPNYRKTNGATLAPAIRGFLVVEPNQHRGDETRASGLVKGKPFLLGVSWRPYTDETHREPHESVSNVHKPLAQFKAALLGTSVKAAERGNEDA